jgi:GMP synthase (glutamine-hydrolysing)
MSRLLVFQHVAAEPLGTLDPLIRRRGHRIRFVNFERDPGAQPRMDRYRGLVVLGGPMNVRDRHERAHLLTELRVIEQALAQDKPVLGICLGAQLLAHVLGADVREHEAPEIGWYPLQLTDAGRADPVLQALAPEAPVFQWHGHTFDLPPGAVQLARTGTCEQQAFRWGRHAYGLQFHPEVDARLIGRWLQHPGYAQELCHPALPHDAAQISQHTQDHAVPMQRRAEPLFEGFLDLVGRPQRRIALPSREWA